MSAFRYKPFFMVQLALLLSTSCSPSPTEQSHATNESQVDVQELDSSGNREPGVQEHQMPVVDESDKDEVSGVAKAEDVQPDSATESEVQPMEDDGLQVVEPLDSKEHVQDAKEALDATAEAVHELQEPQAQLNTNIISDDTSPLSDELRQKLAAIPWDVPPEVLNAVEKENEGGHFPFSDELHPEKFRETIQDMGGTYIGIGTDQSYVYMGWQKPTLAFAVDYDPWVVYIHHAYIAFFDHCEDAACLMAMFDDRVGTSDFLGKILRKQSREEKYH